MAYPFVESWTSSIALNSSPPQGVADSFLGDTQSLIPTSLSIGFRSSSSIIVVIAASTSCCDSNDTLFWWRRSFSLFRLFTFDFTVSIGPELFSPSIFLFFVPTITKWWGVREIFSIFTGASFSWDKDADHFIGDFPVPWGSRRPAVVVVIDDDGEVFFIFFVSDALFWAFLSFFSFRTSSLPLAPILHQWFSISLAP